MTVTVERVNSHVVEVRGPGVFKNFDNQEIAHTWLVNAGYKIAQKWTRDAGDHISGVYVNPGEAAA